MFRFIYEEFEIFKGVDRIQFIVFIIGRIKIKIKVLVFKFCFFQLVYVVFFEFNILK